VSGSLKIQDAKNSPSGHHHKTSSGYIFATKAHIDNRTKLVKHQYLFHTSPQYGELRPTSSWDLSGSLGHPCKFQRVSRLCSITARHCSSGRQPNYTALNRRRHLYSAGRPSHWALAHTSSLNYVTCSASMITNLTGTCHCHLRSCQTRQTLAKNFSLSHFWNIVFTTHVLKAQIGTIRSHRPYYICSRCGLLLVNAYLSLLLMTSSGPAHCHCSLYINSSMSLNGVTHCCRWV